MTTLREGHPRASGAPIQNLLLILPCQHRILETVKESFKSYKPLTPKSHGEGPMAEEVSTNFWDREQSANSSFRGPRGPVPAGSAEPGTVPDRAQAADVRTPSGTKPLSKQLSRETGHCPSGEARSRQPDESRASMHTRPAPHTEHPFDLLPPRLTPTETAEPAPQTSTSKAGNRKPILEPNKRKLQKNRKL